jgi:hypothetical protein
MEKNRLEKRMNWTATNREITTLATANSKSVKSQNTTTTTYTARPMT